jgi:hypothetical protein
MFAPPPSISSLPLPKPLEAFGQKRNRASDDLGRDASLAHRNEDSVAAEGIVKLTAERKNTFHSAGISAGSEALTSYLRI